MHASCIKFTVHFRNQIGKERLQKLMVNLCEATANPAVVLKSYAAHAVERCLVMKGANFTLADIGADLVTKLVNQLCTGIAQAENQYMMRALLRVLTMIYKDSNTIKIPDTAVQTLRGALERAAKNPAKPDYNAFKILGSASKFGHFCHFQKLPNKTSLKLHNLLKPFFCRADVLHVPKQFSAPDPIISTRCTTITCSNVSGRPQESI